MRRRSPVRSLPQHGESVSDRLVRFPGTSWEETLPADAVTIWYTVTVHEGQEVISVQHVSLDT
jgi:hypothetical protein